MVVVTINHRLNAFGYLHLADLGGEEFAGSGVAGMLDIVLALEWVRDNAAAFGGDPGNVTIFGESGGGAKVSTLLAMPAAKGLFHRAIVQSGPGLRGVERADAQRVRRAPARAARARCQARRQAADTAAQSSCCRRWQQAAGRERGRGPCRCRAPAR